MKKQALLSIASILLVNVASFGINSSTVCNTTNVPISVVWTAVGCSHIDLGHPEACASIRHLQPSQCAKHQYRWGDTDDNIHIGDDRKTCRKTQAYIDNKPVIETECTNDNVQSAQGNVWGNCHFHSMDNHTVHINSISNDYLTGGWSNLGIAGAVRTWEAHWNVDCQWRRSSGNSQEAFISV